MFLSTYRLTQLAEKGTMSHEQASLVKAWNTLRARETVALAREVMGGNGILSDFHVAKVREQHVEGTVGLKWGSMTATLC